MFSSPSSPMDARFCGPGKRCRWIPKRPTPTFLTESPEKESRIGPMAEQQWAFPAEMRPRPEDWRFDLDAALDAVVQVRAEIPEDAFTAPILGTEAVGNGVVIRDDGLVLTIGYLITEASTIWLTTNKGTVAGAFPIAYDQATGFGLVQPLGKLGVDALSAG